MSKLLTVIIDDEKDRSTRLADLWKTVLESANLSSTVTVLFDIDDTHKIFQDRPNIVIADNVFENNHTERDNAGIDLIADHKASYPDAVFILCTKGSFKIDILGSKFPNPDIIVPKVYLSSKSYQAYLGQEIRRRLNRIPLHNVTFTDPADPLQFDAAFGDCKSILEQSVLPVNDPSGAFQITTVHLNKLGGGFSGSKVYEAALHAENRQKTLPFVFKFSKIDFDDDARDEERSYNLFARLQVPHHMRVDLIGAGRTARYSGALYAFALGKKSGLQSLATRISAHDTSPVEKICEQLFLSGSVGWYKDIRFTKNADDFYNNSREYSPKKDPGRISQLRQTANEIFDPTSVLVDTEFLTYHAVRFPQVRRYLEKFDQMQVPECICHGDLNTNNILLDASGDGLSLIDFEYTGVDNAYKDFVSLECSIRVDYDIVGSASRETTLILEKSEYALLVKKDLPSKLKSIADAEKYFGAVKLVRDTAQRALTDVGVPYDVSLYRLALGFHLLKLLGIEGLKPAARARLFAAYVGVLRALHEHASRQM